eukprot:XP_003241742.1 PREDICTED: uncharacterized protein LOC100573069 [Acyrthosiphon pisum]
MDNQNFFSLMKTPNSPSAIVLSSDSSWTFNSDSDTSLPTSRPVDVAEIRPSVAVKICPAVKTTDTIAKVVNLHPDCKPINAHVISPTVTEEQSTDPQSTDEQATDEQATDEQATDTHAITEELTPTVAVSPIYDDQQVCSSGTLLSFDDLYGIDGEDICAKPQSSDSSGVAYKRHVTVRVDVAVQVDFVNLQQGRASSSGGDAGHLQTSMGFRSGIAAEARDIDFQSGDMKWRIPVASIGSIDTDNRRLTADRCKPKVAKNLMINNDKQIIKVYMNQSNKVSSKPAPFMRRSSSFINRQATQRETDRINYIMVKKLISAKAEVSTFR